MQWPYTDPAATQLLCSCDPGETELDDDDESGLVDTEERVSEALRNLHSIADEITITSLPTDLAEEDLVSKFMSTGCGCVKRCSKQFSLEYVRSVRRQCTEQERAELDMAILGQLMASTNTSFTVSTVARHAESERQRSYTSFVHQGKPVCTQMFLFLHTIGTKWLKNLLKNYKENSLRPRVHGNTKRKPKHALTYASRVCSAVPAYLC